MMLQIVALFGQSISRRITAGGNRSIDLQTTRGKDKNNANSGPDRGTELPNPEDRQKQNQEIVQNVNRSRRNESLFNVDA